MSWAVYTLLFAASQILSTDEFVERSRLSIVNAGEISDRTQKQEPQTGHSDK